MSFPYDGTDSSKVVQNGQEYDSIYPVQDHHPQDQYPQDHHLQDHHPQEPSMPLESHDNPDHEDTPTPQRGRRKERLWFIAAIVALSAIAIALGAVLGVKINQDDAYLEYQVWYTRTATVTSLVSPTAGSPKATITSTPTLRCPDAHNKITDISIGKRRYRILCDYNFSDRKILSSITFRDLDACVNFCDEMNGFQQRSDIGFTYNLRDEPLHYEGACWCEGQKNGTISTDKSVGRAIGYPV